MYTTCDKKFNYKYKTHYDAIEHCFLLFLCLQEELTSALATMRVDYDQVKIKDLDASSNPLLNKRRKKAATGEKSGGSGCSSQ